MRRLFLHLDVSAQSPVKTTCHIEEHRRHVVSLVPPKMAQEAHLSLLTVVNSFACLALFFAFSLSIFCAALQPCQPYQLSHCSRPRRERPTSLHHFHFAFQSWRRVDQLAHFITFYHFDYFRETMIICHY